MSMGSVSIGERAGVVVRGLRAAKLEVLDPGERVAGEEAGFRESRQVTSCGVEYDLYDPGQDAKTFIIMPNLCIKAEHEPQAMNLARGLAAQGIRAAVPKLPAMSECRFSFIDIDAIVDLAIELEDLHRGKVGMIGFGFGAGLAARAATEKEIRDFIDPIVLVGPYYSLPELWPRLGRSYRPR